MTVAVVLFSLFLSQSVVLVCFRWQIPDGTQLQELKRRQGVLRSGANSNGPIVFQTTRVGDGVRDGGRNIFFSYFDMERIFRKGRGTSIPRNNITTRASRQKSMTEGLFSE